MQKSLPVDKTRIAAWLVALLANAVFVFYLTTAHRLTSTAVLPTAQNRVQLYFIAPPKPEPPVVAMPIATQVKPTAKKGLQAPRAQTMPVARQDAEDASASARPASDMRDDWFVGVVPQAPRTAAQGENFASDPLRRRPARMEATVNRMALDMRDSSLGGRLRAMSRSNICKDLRAQLSSNPASASAILASMERHGCNKKRN